MKNKLSPKSGYSSSPSCCLHAFVGFVHFFNDVHYIDWKNKNCNENDLNLNFHVQLFILDVAQILIHTHFKL